MRNRPTPCARRAKVCVGLCAVAWFLASAPAAMAVCRVTDFTDRSLSSLNEIERLSFVSQMTQTEYDRLKKAAPGSANYYSLLVNSPSLTEARKAARTRIASLKIENSDYYIKIWASDFLTDQQLQRFTNCISLRQPGLIPAGRFERPSTFHLTFAHVTPIGLEKITLRLVASHNIANIDEFEAFLVQLGARDNYTPETFALRLKDPARPAVLVVRAGWETPLFIYIPSYPAPDVPQ